MWESMDVVLQQHDAKHIYKVPEGLRELCSDISREVLRSQPPKIYQFISDYVNALLITRENTKVAVQVVGNILSGSEAIVNILFQTRLTLEQIVAVAPRVQKAFREYLDSIDQQDSNVCEGYTCDEKSKLLLKEILEATGATEKQAHRAATVIQAAFRGHYERMKLNETKGLIMWQRAVGNTLNILKKAGVPQREIAKAAPLIQFAYRGYYTRRNIKIKEACQPDEELQVDDVIEPRDNLQAVAWLNMLFEESGLTIERANEAAYVIQKAYRRYRLRKHFQEPQRVESTRSMVVEAIIEQLRQRVFTTVMTREDVPSEYGTREEMKTTGMKLEIMYKEHMRQSRLSAEGAPTKVEVPDKVSDELPEEVPDEVPGGVPIHEEFPSEAEEKGKDMLAHDYDRPDTKDKMDAAVDVKRHLSDLGDKVEHEIEHSPDEEQLEQKERHHEIEILSDDDHEDDHDEEHDDHKREEEQAKEGRKESIEKPHKEESTRESHEPPTEETRKKSHEPPAEEPRHESREKHAEETRKESPETPVEESRTESREEHAEEDKNESQELPAEEDKQETQEEPAIE